MMFKLIPAESVHSFFQRTFDGHLSQANKKNHSNLCENFQVFGTILSVWCMLAHLIYPNVENDFSYFTKNKKGVQRFDVSLSKHPESFRLRFCQALGCSVGALEHYVRRGGDVEVNVSDGFLPPWSWFSSDENEMNLVIWQKGQKDTETMPCNIYEMGFRGGSLYVLKWHRVQNLPALIIPQTKLGCTHYSSCSRRVDSRPTAPATC